MYKKPLRELSNGYSHLSLKRKVSINSMVVLVLVIATLSIWNYYRSSNYEASQQKESFSSMYSKTQAMIDNFIINISEISEYIMVNSEIQNLAIKADYTLEEELNLFFSLSDVVTEYSIGENVGDIALHVDEEFIFSREKANFFDISSELDTNWYESVMKLNGTNYWSMHNGSISCSRKIVNFSTVEFPAIVSIYPDMKKFYATFDDLSDLFVCDVYLFDINDELIITHKANNTEIDVKKIQEFIVSDSPNDILISINCKSYLTKSDLSNGWSMCIYLHEENFEKSNVGLVTEAIIIFLLATLVSSFLTHLLVMTYTKRIMNISKKISKINLDSNNYIEEKYNDEISQIVINFNKMLQNLRETHSELQTINKLKKEADYDILYEQIKPHFIYNCLDTINWMAVAHKAHDISEISQLLGKFFRLSLSKGNQIVALTDELEHLKIYLEIIKIRFDGIINAKFNINGDINKLKCLKLLLQPIIENCVIHGISEKESQSGNIFISVSVLTSHLEIIVEDDGVGIATDKLYKINDNINCSKGDNFGISNINQRIKLYHGESYGLTIDSIYNKGTQVTYILPLIYA